MRRNRDRDSELKAKGPMRIALRFNEAITRHDLKALSRLMTGDHAFIDRDGTVVRSKPAMIKAWKDFFEMFPAYHNTFARVESRGNQVVMLGHAYWSADRVFDPAIWIATIVEDLVGEWRISDDTPDNRRRFGLE